MRSVTVEFLGKSVITIDDVQLTPASAHLFGLVLLVADARGRVVSRRQLQQLLFPPGESAAHPLRQLLYRARQLGVSLTSDGDRLVASRIHVETSLDRFEAMGPSGRAALTPDQLRFLPGWEPQLPPPFVDWLAIRQDEVHTRLITVLTADFAQFRRTSDWASASRVGRLLSRLVPLDERLACQWAEALHMIGRSAEGMAALDQLLEEETASVTFHEARALRKRLERLPSRSRSSPLVGRQDCLAFLRGELEQLDHERGGRVCVLVGPPGIGKTRMGEEFGRSLEVAGTPVLYHRCDSRSRLTPLSLFAQLLRSLIAMRGSLGASPVTIALLEAHLGLGESLTELPTAAAIEKLRLDLRQAIVDLFEAVSGERRFAILVDDAHLLDDASIEELRALATSHNSIDAIVVANCRPSQRLVPLFERGRRVCSFLMRPFSAADSRRFLTNALPDLLDDQRRLETLIEQGGGIPFHLLAITSQLKVDSIDGDVALDVHSLASSTYLALSQDARLTLECCMLLGELATADRIESVAGIGGGSLLIALGELEELGLISLVNERIQGPHALLEAAILALVPPTRLKAMRQRLAQSLTRECTGSPFNSRVTLAAADAWVAAGNHTQAVPLFQRCASAAASLGEPGAASQLLFALARETLPPIVRHSILTDLVRHSQAANGPDIAAIALGELLAICIRNKGSEEERASLEFALVSNGFLKLTSASQVHPTLYRLANSRTLSPLLRAQALLHELIIADVTYDAPLAHWAYCELQSEAYADVDISLRLRASLVYHVTFGQVTEARALIDSLLVAYPQCNAEASSLAARRYAAYGYYRMLFLSLSRTINLSNYHFARANGSFFDGIAAASSLTEIGVSTGDFDAARHWFEVCEDMFRGGRESHRYLRQDSYCSSATILFLLDGRYDDALRIVDTAMSDDPLMREPRHEAVGQALRIRVAVMRGDRGAICDILPRLRDLYERGKSLGAQDTIAEMLWAAYVSLDREPEAHTLLSDYLMIHKRELDYAEFSLLHTTAADRVWQSESPRVRTYLATQFPRHV